MDYKQESKKLKHKFYTEIQQLLNEGYSYNQIAKKLNATPQHINYIVQKHLRGGENK